MTIVQVWRCKICGETYIGDEAPTQCPFCGAHKRYLMLANKEDVKFDVELSEDDKALVEKALQVEIDNSQFYLCAAKHTKDFEGKAMFKRLSKIEYEHAEVWGNFLKISIPERKAADMCPEEYKANLQDSHNREDRAIKFYTEAAEKAENPRIKETFEAFVEVETDHLTLSEERMK